MTIDEIIIFSKVLDCITTNRPATEEEKENANKVLNARISTVNDMYDLACAFKIAAEVNFVEGKIANRSRLQNVSGFVNLAFACELFLKLLLVGIPYDNKKHKLDELWKVLDSYYHDIAEAIKTDVESTVSSKMTFEEMLEDDSDVFYNFRYFFEPEIMKRIQKNPLDHSSSGSFVSA